MSNENEQTPGEKSAKELIPKEVTPDMLAAILPKAQGIMRTSAVYAAVARKMAGAATRGEWEAEYKDAEMSPIIETLFETADLAQLSIDIGLAVETMLAKPLTSRQIVMLEELRESFHKFSQDIRVDEETGEISDDEDE